MSTDKKKVIYDGMHTEELNAALAANKAKNEALDGNSIVDQVDISTIANEKPETIAPPKKKTSGADSYKTAYDEAGGSAKLGDYAKWEKKARDWNKTKYGSTNPTADAKKAGMSKSELASKHKVDSTKFTESLTIGGKKTAVSDLDPKYTTVGVMAQSPTNTSNNASITKTTTAANSSESLLGGVRSRRRQRQDDRIANRRQRQDDRVENKQQRQTNKEYIPRGLGRKKVVTAVQRKSNTPALDTGPGTYQGGPVKKKNSDDGGEFWGKRGPIK